MKKWFFIVAAIFIAGIVLFIYMSFNGNFVSKLVAKNTANQYLQHKFTDEQVTLVYRAYNFKDVTYMFDMTYHAEGKNWIYTLEVGNAWWPKEVQNITLHADSKDEALTDAWNEVGSDYVKNLLVDDSVRAYYFIEVPRNFSQQQWTPTVETPIEPIILLELAITDETEEQFLQRARSYQQKLDEEGIRYREASVSGYETIDNKDGHKKGYARTYTQGRYYVTFEPHTVITSEDFRK